jgi:cytochrome P450
VLCSRTQDFYKDEPCPALIPVLTRSSPNINNFEAWARTRRQSPMTQPWTGQWRRGQMPALRGVLRRWAERMAATTGRQAVPLLAEMRRLTFDCFSVGTLGRELPDALYNDFMLLATQGSKRMLNPLCRPAPDLNATGIATRVRFLKFLRDQYDAAAANPNPAAFDLLSMALRNHSELPADELSAEMGNVYYGGAFSCPSTLVSALYLLTQHPDEAQKLTAAVRQLGDDCDLESLLECKPLDYALRESMRLLPAVPMLSRRVLTTAATELGGCRLPPNTNIWICNWLLQRAAPPWDQPLKFLPDRWSAGVAEANPLGSDYFFPEGRGPRICLGLEYSIFYMKLVLATLLSRWDIQCGEGQLYDEGQGFFFGVRMPFGLRARIRPRVS